MSENNCEDVIPLKDWIKETNQKICRPCTLPILVQWYESELEETGNKDAGNNLREIINKTEVTPDEVAAELDNIKARVGGDLKKRLRELDCAIQKNEQFIPTE